MKQVNDVAGLFAVFDLGQHFLFGTRGLLVEYVGRIIRIQMLDVGGQLFGREQLQEILAPVGGQVVEHLRRRLVVQRVNHELGLRIAGQFVEQGRHIRRIQLVHGLQHKRIVLVVNCFGEHIQVFLRQFKGHFLNRKLNCQNSMFEKGQTRPQTWKCAGPRGRSCFTSPPAPLLLRGEQRG